MAEYRDTRHSRGGKTLAPDGDGGGARPYVSLVLGAEDHDASPVLLLSDLADHSRNLKADARAALLFDGTAGRDDPLTEPRAPNASA